MRSTAPTLALLAALSGTGCAHEWADDEGAALGVAVVRGALIDGAVRSLDGTYGAGCLGPGKAGASWSVSLGGALAYPALSVVKNDGGCTLFLTRFHTASTTYTASAPIALLLTPASAPVPFTGSGVGVLANATVDTLTYAGTAVTVSLSVGDVRLASSTPPVRYTYDAQVTLDAPVSYWRLNDAVATLANDPLGTPGVDLKDHVAGGVGWMLHTIASSPLASAVIDQGSVRASAASRTAVYYASTVPTSADYDVTATVRVGAAGTVNGLVDQAGVYGRMSTDAHTGYFAGLVTRNALCGLCVTAREWVLRRCVAGTCTDLRAPAAALLSQGTSYLVTLRLRGSTVELMVDGSSVMTASDTTITSAGRAGLSVGGGVVAPSFSNGTPIDHFSVKTIAANAIDAIGGNHGVHSHNILSTVPGALTGPVSSSNGALPLLGVNHTSIFRDPDIGKGDFSVEFWFKYAGGAMSTATNWWDGMGMVDANSTSVLNLEGFGVSMRSDGRVMAGAASSCNLPCTRQLTIVSPLSYGDNAWHHVVFTRRHLDGQLVLYIDGAESVKDDGPAGRSLNPLTTVSVGRLQIQLLSLLWSTNYFTGAIDELAFYKAVLTSAQVTAHYNARTY